MQDIQKDETLEKANACAAIGPSALTSVTMVLVLTDAVFKIEGTLDCHPLRLLCMKVRQGADRVKLSDYFASL